MTFRIAHVSDLHVLSQKGPQWRAMLGRDDDAEAATDRLLIAVHVPKIDNFVQTARISRDTFYDHFEEKETSS